MSTNSKICKQFIARSAEQGLKGHRRDRAATEFVLGAAAGAIALGMEKEAQSILFLASVVAVRGFSMIEQIAAKEEEKDAGGESPATDQAPEV